MKLAWIAYWVTLGVAICSTTLWGNTVGGVCLAAWLACHIWLATIIADAAGATAQSSAIWGLGAIFLGPAGAIIFPLTLLPRLKAP